MSSCTSRWSVLHLLWSKRIMKLTLTRRAPSSHCAKKLVAAQQSTITKRSPYVSSPSLQLLLHHTLDSLVGRKVKDLWADSLCCLAVGTAHYYAAPSRIHFTDCLDESEKELNAFWKPSDTITTGHHSQTKRSFQGFGDQLSFTADGFRRTATWSGTRRAAVDIREACTTDKRQLFT